METTSGIVGAVRTLAPALGQHPVAVWDAAREGTQRAADVLPEGMGMEHVKGFIRKHPVLATCAVLAIGGLLSARGLVAQHRV